MTYIDSAYASTVPYHDDIEGDSHLQLAPNGVFSLPSAPSGGFIVEFSYKVSVDFDQIEDRLSGESFVEALLIDYNSSNSTYVVVEHRKIDFVNDPELGKKGTLMWNVPKHTVTGHSYRVRFSMKQFHTYERYDPMYERWLPAEPTSVSCAVRVRGVTQL